MRRDEGGKEGNAEVGMKLDQVSFGVEIELS